MSRTPEQIEEWRTAVRARLVVPLTTTISGRSTAFQVRLDDDLRAAVALGMADARAEDAPMFSELPTDLLALYLQGYLIGQVRHQT